MVEKEKSTVWLLIRWMLFFASSNATRTLVISNA